MLDRGSIARSELGTTPNRARLDILLERLRRDTVPAEGSRMGVVERFVATLTVSVPTQVRKILEGHPSSCPCPGAAASSVLAAVYERLAHYCENSAESAGPGYTRPSTTGLDMTAPRRTERRVTPRCAFT